jgi:hypothetical protein
MDANRRECGACCASRVALLFLVGGPVVSVRDPEDNIIELPASSGSGTKGIENLESGKALQNGPPRFGLGNLPRIETHLQCEAARGPYSWGCTPGYPEAHLRRSWSVLLRPAVASLISVSQLFMTERSGPA